MAIAISHTFVSAKADGGDTSLVQPSNWNAAHTLAGFGTGVETALAVNVGSAGAFVVNGGALGTPSSGTLTNATGLPAAGVVGTAAILGSNTFTATQTIVASAAGATALILKGAASYTGDAIRVTDSSDVAKITIGANGNAGTWQVACGAGTTARPSLILAAANYDTGFWESSANVWTFNRGALQRFTMNNLVFQAVSSYVLSWTNSTTVSTGGADTGLERDAAGVVKVTDSASSLRDLKLRNVVGQTGYTEMVEMTAPGAGAANTARIYAVDNGAGKTQLMVIFASGAAQQIAIEP